MAAVALSVVLVVGSAAPSPAGKVRPGPGNQPDPLVAMELAVEEYLHVEHYLAIQNYLALAAAEAESKRVAAAQAARTSTPVRTAGEVGECTGFAIPDYIIQRESGGSSTAANPSGTYGCAQTLLSHYSSGACRGLDPYTLDGQRACVDILSAGGTNLAPWAATR